MNDESTSDGTGPPPEPTDGGLDLFTGEPQHEKFHRMSEFFPTSPLVASPEPHVFPAGPELTLPETHEFDGTTRSSADFLADTDTAALLVVHNGARRFEQYWLTGGPDVQWISWSVAKSFVSALIGIAIDEGHIGSVDEPISSYVPELAGSAYDGVSIRSVLQMSSGASWNEDYSDPDSDIARFGAVISGAGSLLDFVSGMTREREPGTFCQYNSADTQVLGHMLIAATGRTITAYMQEKLSTPLGMESPGYWMVDGEGVEMAFGGLNLTARDYAKLGELFRLGGQWNGQQLVPADWVAESTSSSEPHMQEGQMMVGEEIFPFGYAYQWWIPSGKTGAFTAIGIYNQFVFVDPASGATVVKLSANHRYGLSPYEADDREGETVAFIRAVIAEL
jgi:CubicO group peptidase (beta-lactamase class C family)